MKGKSRDRRDPEQNTSGKLESCAWLIWPFVIIKLPLFKKQKNPDIQGTIHI